MVFVVSVEYLGNFNLFIFWEFQNLSHLSFIFPLKAVYKPQVGMSFNYVLPIVPLNLYNTGMYYRYTFYSLLLSFQACGNYNQPYTEQIDL